MDRHVPAQGVQPLGVEKRLSASSVALGQIGILPGEEGPQAITENDLLESAVELDAMDAAMPETFQTLGGRKLELGLAAPVRQGPLGYPEWLTSMGLPVARA